MSELGPLKRQLTDWLFDRALPLWSAAGIDPATGAFQEAIDHAGRPLALPRRARGQARQTYVQCWAGARGWAGEWSRAAGGGFDAFLGCYRRSDGLFRTLAAPDGTPLDDAALLYDQAFALFAFAAVAGALTDRREQATLAAIAVRQALAAQRNPAGGFLEVGPHPHQSNPHMHLLEACLAWEAVSDDPAWSALADEVVALALARFIDAEGGYLREFFQADWSPATGDAGRVVEPGHQFEWAWLLDVWGERRGHAPARAAAARLYRIGADHGIDDLRGVAINQLTDALAPHDDSARLWPQTERLRSALRFGDQEGAVQAARALLRYLDTPVQGLWRDKLKPDGRFVEEPAPATSFYHIVGAVGALMDA